MASPKPLTVLMAVYNGMPYLPAAVESILAQTYQDFEFLIINDHSSDGSMAYLESVKDPRVRVVTNSGKGLTAALNFGLEQAQSEWIARMDSDDWSFPERLAAQMAAPRPPGTVLVSADYMVCDEELLEAGEIHLCPPNERLFAYLRNKNNPFCHPVMMINRRAALEVGGYRYDRAQDYDLWIRILDRGQLVHVEQTLLKYRVRQDAISIMQVKDQSDSRVAIQNQTSAPNAAVTPKEESEGPYAYRLGFSAWVAGNRMGAAGFLPLALVRGYNVFRCLAALGLMILPRRWYLNLAGYRGVYQ